MFNLSNLLSFLRIPLAFMFLIDDTILRCIVILLAMLTDFLDGYLARRFRKTSSFGAVLDPLTDKFFVLLAIFIFIFEGQIKIWEAVSLISRDFAILIFGGYLSIKGSWATFKFQSIWAGKITTTLQFFVLIGLTCKIIIPVAIFWCFVALGILALGELYFIEQKMLRKID